MKQTCRNSWCKVTFEISEEDLASLDRLSPKIAEKKEPLPPPLLCPDCRIQRRLAQVNQMNLYERTCDLTGAKIISNTHPSVPCKVFRQEDWYSDKWDPFSYGLEVDLGRPFFEQIQKLLDIVPRPSLFTGFEFDENCEYTNNAGKNKNCYLIFDSDENWDCYYCYSINQCHDCVDCFRSRKSQLCYECVDCVQCYGSSFLQDCENCSDSMFLKNCTGCKNCLMCSNLRNKEYHVENKPVSKEAFAQFRAMLASRQALRSGIQRFAKIKLEFPQKYMHGVQNEDVVGDYLVHCKNAYQCYDSEDLWDCRYIYQGFMPLKDCMDVHECGDAERLYECSVCGYGMQEGYFSTLTLTSVHDVFYCHHCHHTKHCFGCVGLNRKEYCILNKQYTKEQYEALVSRIVALMRTHGEWGEFMPVTSSIHAYNETLAQDYFPLTKQQALDRGWRWLDEPDKRAPHTGPRIQVPDSIAETGDEICKSVLTCEISKRPYKIIPQELAFYRRMNVPVPLRSFSQRHADRRALRNPRHLWTRTCMKCSKSIDTSYAPDRPEKVYCEQCYLKEVY
ncbi:MAG: hypothetical protein PHX87_02875 [Candidatus Peribacteraceae bacterium]|nr:hypothetical protein [Candidatus Peribacteraceae bacterium]MDD5742352.1 hypothetical protein [Candidatus Peribacteraceae bacterium]